MRTLNEEVHGDRATLHAALKRAARDWLPAIGSWDEARFDALPALKACGAIRYFTQDGERIALLQVVHGAGGPYLRTKSDAAPGNNLDNLPSGG